MWLSYELDKFCMLLLSNNDRVCTQYEGERTNCLKATSRGENSISEFSER